MPKQLNIVSVNVLDHVMIQFPIMEVMMFLYEIITGLTFAKKNLTIHQIEV